MRECSGMRLFMLAATLAALLAGAGCGGGGGGDDGGTGVPQPTAASLTTRGWTAFTAGDLAAALADFAAAIALDPGHADAHVGQGWARLHLATSSGDLSAAVASFTAGIAAGASGGKVLGGRAAAYLALGGTSLSLCVTDAMLAVQQDGGFAMPEQTSFDHRDLRLLEAFARAGQNDLAGALTAANAVASSGIESGNGATWVVAGTTYATYEAAVLAFLHELSNQYAG